MKIAIITVVALTLSNGIGMPCALGADSVNISVRGDSEPEIRYTSDKVICVEGLVNHKWAARYWSADGLLPFPMWLEEGKSPFSRFRPETPAFEMTVRFDPADKTDTILTTGWRWIAGKQLPAAGKNTRHFVVELAHEIHPMKVNVHTMLDGTPVMVRWLEIINTSPKPVALMSVYPWVTRFWSLNLGLNLDLGYQSEGQRTIGWFEWKPLPNGKTTIESVKGLGFDDPFFIVRDKVCGEYVIGHLAWPANWRMEFDANSNRESPQAGVTLKMGPLSKNALRVIAPGQAVQTPSVHLGYIEGDFDTAIQAMHEHIRLSVMLPPLAPERANRIELNIPGDNGYHIGDEFNEQAWFGYIDLAAAIGAELVLVDTGWSDTTPQWNPSPRRFPRGMAPVREYAHKKGLLFGLQTECEGGRPDFSTLFKEHPDWEGPCNVLRLDKPEVEEFLFSLLDGFMNRYQPDLYRHEYIPNCPQIGHFAFEWAQQERDGFVENCYWRYYDAVYRIFDRINQKYPKLILQMCSNGGTREDLGMLAHFHETYTQEAGPPHVLKCYSGKTLALPPEVLVIGLHTWPWRGHLDTRLRMLFALSTPQIVTGVAPGVEDLTPQIRERYLHYANIYKNFIRPILPTCKVYHHDPVNSHGGVGSSPWFAMEFAAPDRSKAWALISRLEDSETDMYLFRPRGLHPGKIYRVTFDNIGASAEVDGLRLMNNGLSIRLEKETHRSSELLLFEGL